MDEPAGETGRIRVAALVGPTAVGKSEAALALAQELHAEIVSCDSMQAYRGMDIGTAKPTPAQCALVPHHMIDVVDPSRALTAAGFQGVARRAIAGIAARGHLPLLVGGSGLYFRAVVDELRFPPRDARVKTNLESEALRLGAAALHERLRGLDPEAAARIEPGNGRRTVRALEVIEITGRPFSAGYSWRYHSHYELEVFGLTRPRPELYERIALRVEAMLGAGLVDEARGLAARGMSRAARQALGYKQILEAPEGAGRADLGPAIVRATKRFARRQESWFGADPRVRWLDGSDQAAIAGLGEALRAPARPR